jgi:hypothetical protein
LLLSFVPFLLALVQVEAADRLGVDLSGEGGAAAAVFSVVDDIVSFVERPNVSLLPHQQLQQPAR